MKSALLPILSRPGFLKLKQRKQFLIDDLENSTRAMGHSASIDNDLRENPEFMQLRTKVTYQIPNELAEIDRILRAHILIDQQDLFQSDKLDEVIPGTQITLQPDDDTPPLELIILGLGDGDPSRGIVSYLSPIAAAVLHHTIGDEVRLPGRGETIFEIQKIQHAQSSLI
jgi:transcription elongation GreA/GreB family factor